MRLPIKSQAEIAWIETIITPYTILQRALDIEITVYFNRVNHKETIIKLNSTKDMPRVIKTTSA